MITCLEINTRAIGNALFEYATLFGVGQKLGFDIRMPVGKNHIHENTGQRIWQLKEIFNIQTPDISQEEMNSIQYTYTEKRKEFNPEIFTEVKDSTNLIGFFQHEDYFNFCEDKLKEQLTFGNAWIYRCIKIFSDLGVHPKDCIAIHVRRGDYTKPHLQVFHPLLPIDYYQYALRLIGDETLIHKFHIPRKILVFSDDPEYCRKVFSGESVIIIDNKGDDANIIDICMMSMIPKIIIANSSYSYWAARLGTEKDIVIYPSVWFGSGYGNYNIVSNKGWIKL